MKSRDKAQNPSRQSSRSVILRELEEEADPGGGNRTEPREVWIKERELEPGGNP